MDPKVITASLILHPRRPRNRPMLWILNPAAAPFHISNLVNQGVLNLRHAINVSAGDDGYYRMRLILALAVGFGDRLRIPNSDGVFGFGHGVTLQVMQACACRSSRAANQSRLA